MAADRVRQHAGQKQESPNTAQAVEAGCWGIPGTIIYTPSVQQVHFKVTTTAPIIQQPKQTRTPDVSVLWSRWADASAAKTAIQ